MADELHLFAVEDAIGTEVEVERQFQLIGLFHGAFVIMNTPMLADGVRLHAVNGAVRDTGHVAGAQFIFTRADADAALVFEEVDGICGVAVREVKDRIEQVIVAGAVDEGDALTVDFKGHGGRR